MDKNVYGFIDHLGMMTIAARIGLEILAHLESNGAIIEDEHYG